MRSVADEMREAIAQLRGMPTPFQGVTTTDPQEVYECEKCADTGWIVTPIGGVVVSSFPCDCDLGYRIRYGNRLPADARNWTLDNWPGHPHTVRDQVDEWLCGDGWLLISGPVGVGKTSLAIGLHKAYCNKRGAGASMFWTVADLLATIKASFGKEDGYDPRGYVNSVGLLVLDDWGKDKKSCEPNENQLGSTFDRETIQNIIMAKYGNGTRLIITTNAPTQELFGVLDKRVADRLSSKALIISLTGKSMRRKA